MMSRAAARLLFAACLVLGVASPGRARADDDATTEMARQRFREGVGFYDQRQYDKARMAFLQAYALKPHPSILLNLAQSELRGGRAGDAAGHFTEYLKTNSEASEAEKQEAELGLAAAKSKVGEVSVTVDVSGAQISVDGEEKGTAPLAGPLYLAPGSHTIDARSNDKRASKSVTATAGQSAAVSLSLRGGGAATAPAPAGTPKEETAPPPKEAAEEAAPEEQPAEAEQPAAAEVTTAGRKPFFEWWMGSPVAITGTVIGVAGVGAGVAFAALSGHDYSSANSYKRDIQTAWSEDLAAKQNEPDPAKRLDGFGPCALPPDAAFRLGAGRVNQYQVACKKFDNAKSSADSEKTIAIVAGAVGGVALVGTVVYYFVDPHAKATAGAAGGFRARLVPWTGTGTSGLSVVGSF